MKYFVTGATGFLGGVLVKQLRMARHEVYVLVRDPQKAQDLETLGVKLFKGDVTDKESMREGMTGTDGVFHVAGVYKYGPGNRKSVRQVNIDGTHNVLELMQELKIPRGVYTSTLAVYSDTKGKIVDENYRFNGTHISEYDRSKAIAHETARRFISHGLPLVIVQPGVIYGPGDTSMVRAALLNLFKGQLPVLPLETAQCWAHVDDVARGHMLAMEKGKISESYHINGDIYNTFDAYKLASEISGKRMPMGIPPNMVRMMSVLVKPIERFLPEEYSSEYLRTLAGTTYLGDNSKAKKELGFDPRPVRECWPETIRYEMKLAGL